MLIDWIFLAVTGFIAWHAIRGFRADVERRVDAEADGAPEAPERGLAEFVRLLFGCIAAVFFLLVLFRDILGVAI